MTNNICLNCSNQPCTCGEAYKKLNEKELLKLIDVLIDQAKDRSIDIKCMVDNRSLKSHLLDIPDDLPLFSDEFMAITYNIYAIKPWIEFMKGRKDVGDLWDAIEKEKDNIICPNIFKIMLWLKTLAYTTKDGEWQYYDLVDNILKLTLRRHDSPIWEIYDKLPSQLGQRIMSMNDIHFVELCAKAGEHEEDLAIRIYQILLGEYDAHTSFEVRYSHIINFLATYSGISVEGLTPAQYIAKYQDELYYTDQELSDLWTEHHPFVRRGVNVHNPNYNEKAALEKYLANLKR